jgi:putative hydrolase of the HAD superfamily
LKAVEHIFFDLDHTIWDFETNSKETLSEIWNEFSLNKIIGNKERFLATYQTVNAIYWKKYRDGIIDKKTVRFGRFADTLRRFKVENAETLGQEIGDRYVERGPHKTALFPFAHETLTYLSRKYPLHIITNGFSEVQGIKLEGSDLDKYFDVVLCSEEVGVNKPHRKVFETALRKANISAAKSVMIGDNYEADIMGAKKVGMQTILFDPHKANSTSQSLVIHSLLELKKIF